ncbi:MAG TPA: hypothetical protein PLE61_15965 [Vicinamibacterales bacterium]|nr:hypothetical protein [Vicinamibacterales bacterium]
MKINVENMLRHASQKERDWLIGELVRCLKEVRDRARAGDTAAVDEFFALFIFDGDEAKEGDPRHA